MNAFPASIEAHLKEAGFTGTEILALRHLFENQSLTVRELATKTGKSTGVLDQAIKKLISKKIVSKNAVNGSPRYSVISIDALGTWLKRDVEAKKMTLQRKAQDFDQFLATMKVDKHRPDMEYFEGQEGIQKAYMKLLDCGEELLQYYPVLCKEEEDPLRSFRVQYFRERMKRGIFMRVIAQDTPLGRRFHSRDAFEFRKTVLVPEDKYPFQYEQIICGDIFAVFNYEQERVCLMRFPEFAESERGFFEAAWKNGKERVKKVDAEKSDISVETKTLSAVREFFLSGKSLVAFGVCALLAAGVTFGMYQNTFQTNVRRAGEKAMAIAIEAAPRFSSDDLSELRIEADFQKPEWTKVVSELASIREDHEDIMFAYILRQSEFNPGTVEFVADSHSIDPYRNSDADPSNDWDLNQDGLIDDADYLQWPGQPYEDAPREALLAFNGPTRNSDLYVDQWGTLMSGYAPIHDEAGKSVAVFVVDITVDDIVNMTMESFVPMYYFVGFFLLFVFVRLAAFNTPIGSFSRKLGKR